MSLDKGIEHGKEHRKPYRKSGRFDASCRPGGDCPYCKGNRTINDRRDGITAREVMHEIVDELRRFNMRGLRGL
jgi:hypothetical protein